MDICSGDIRAQRSFIYDLASYFDITLVYVRYPFNFDTMEPDELYERARHKVNVRKKFYSHVITWVVMSVFFIMLNLFTSEYFWAIFPILGWGIAVATHGIRVYTNEWEDNEVDREYERMQRRKRAMQQGIDDEDYV